MIFSCNGSLLLLPPLVYLDYAQISSFTLLSEALLLIDLTTLLSGRPLQLSSRIMARSHPSASVQPYLTLACLTFLVKSSLLDHLDQDFMVARHSLCQDLIAWPSWSRLLHNYPVPSLSPELSLLLHHCSPTWALYSLPPQPLPVGRTCIDFTIVAAPALPGL